MRKQEHAPVKERLSRERIVDCALALADAEGLEAVTIRRLAQDQGVTPMALYWHFKDKDLLLDGIAERLVAEIPVSSDDPNAEGRWDVEFRDLLASILVVLRAHPAVADLLHTRLMRSEPGLDLTERALALLARAGFDPEQSAQLAAHALSSMVLLVTAEPGRQVGEEAAAREQRLRVKRATFQTLSPERYPHLLASADGFVECGSEVAYFDLGLEVLVQGVLAIAPVSAS